MSVLSISEKVACDNCSMKDYIQYFPLSRRCVTFRSLAAYASVKIHCIRVKFHEEFIFDISFEHKF